VITAERKEEFVGASDILIGFAENAFLILKKQEPKRNGNKAKQKKNIINNYI
jgi:hypothetical protein